MSRIRRATGACAAVVGALALAVLATGEDAPSIGASRDAARAALVERLLEVAVWAGKEKLPGRRDATLEEILLLDPDHAKARSMLGFKRTKEGTWARTAKYVTPADKAPDLVPQWTERVEDARRGYRDEMLAVLTDEAVLAAPEEGLDVLAALLAAQRGDEAVLARLTAVAKLLLDESRVKPDQVGRHEALLQERFGAEPAVRSALGQVKEGERWVLPESARTPERRKTLKAAVKGLLESRPAPETSALLPEEKGLEGMRAWTTPRTRVYGTLPDDLLKDVASRLDRLPEIFESALGAKPFLPKVLHQASVASPEEGLKIVEARTPLAPEKRKWIERLQAWWIGEEAIDWIHHAGKEPAHRGPLVLEGAFHRWFQMGIVSTFALQERVEALQEGLATYLTFVATGTRYSWTVTDTYSSGSGGADPGKLRSASFDWATATADFLEKPENANALRLSLPKSYAAQAASDALIAYAFSAFLVEGHPAVAKDLLQKLGKGADLDGAFRQTLGGDPERVQRRLARWCREVGIR